MTPDELEYEYRKQYQLSKLDYCFRIVSLLLCLAFTSIAIYYFGYYYSQYVKMIKDKNTPKIEFRYKPTIA